MTGVTYPNATSSTIPSPTDEALENTSLAVFWLSVVLCLLMGIVSALGNGLVIYISSTKDDFGEFRGVNRVVTNLATSDFLFGLIGCPLTIVFWWWGKKILNR